MRLQPRHYLLIAVLLAIGFYHLWRGRAGRTAPEEVHPGPQTAAWTAFDNAAAQRDAPDPQFTAALDSLRKETDAATGQDAPDLRNCLMWLQYYRHTAPTAGGNAGTWAMLSASHVKTCMTEHRDLGR